MAGRAKIVRRRHQDAADRCGIERRIASSSSAAMPLTCAAAKPSYSVIGMLQNLWLLLASALMGILGWFAANFVGAPLRGFFELRERVRQQILLNSNLGPTKQVTDRWPTDQMIMDERERMEAAASQLRLVASELTAFAIARKINT